MPRNRYMGQQKLLPSPHRACHVALVVFVALLVAPVSGFSFLSVLATPSGGNNHPCATAKCHHQCAFIGHQTSPTTTTNSLRSQLSLCSTNDDQQPLKNMDESNDDEEEEARQKEPRGPQTTTSSKRPLSPLAMAAADWLEEEEEDDEWAQYWNRFEDGKRGDSATFPHPVPHTLQTLLTIGISAPRSVWNGTCKVVALIDNNNPKWNQNYSESCKIAKHNSQPNRLSTLYNKLNHCYPNIRSWEAPCISNMPWPCGRQNKRNWPSKFVERNAKILIETLCDDPRKLPLTLWQEKKRPKMILRANKVKKIKSKSFNGVICRPGGRRYTYTSVQSSACRPYIMVQFLRDTHEP